MHLKSPAFLFCFVLFSVTAETLAGLRKGLQDCISWLMQTDSSVTSISSGCELFLRFITLASLDQEVGIGSTYTGLSTFENCLA